MTLATLLIYLNATSVALISVRNITKWFVSGDIIALVMQAAGAGVQAAVQARRQIGSDIVIAGIAAQILFFGAFVVVTMVADHRLRGLRNLAAIHLAGFPGELSYTVFMSLPC